MLKFLFIDEESVFLDEKHTRACVTLDWQRRQDSYSCTTKTFSCPKKEVMNPCIEVNQQYVRRTMKTISGLTDNATRAKFKNTAHAHTGRYTLWT